MHELKLHLGCGKRFLKGFIHVDIADYKHIFFRQDVRKLDKFADESVELIYASHVIEYFDRDEIVDVLKEWRRVLNVGGILRLAVPDFEALTKVYDYLDDGIPLIRGPIYGEWNIPGTNKRIYHKAIYDFISLKRTLNSAGFKNIRSWYWQEIFTGEHEGFDDYSQSYIPHLDKENGILISLNMEAEK